MLIKQKNIVILDREYQIIIDNTGYHDILIIGNKIYCNSNFCRNLKEEDFYDIIMFKLDKSKSTIKYYTQIFDTDSYYFIKIDKKLNLTLYKLNTTYNLNKNGYNIFLLLKQLKKIIKKYKCKAIDEYLSKIIELRYGI